MKQSRKEEYHFQNGQQASPKLTDRLMGRTHYYEGIGFVKPKDSNKILLGPYRRRRERELVGVHFRRARKSERNWQLKTRFVNWLSHPRMSIPSLFGNKKAVLGITFLIIILGGIALAQGPLFHEYLLIGASSSNSDPFTLLWNGTVTGPSNSVPVLSSIISQLSGGTAQGLGAGVVFTTPVWFGECWKAPISSYIYKFNVSMKKVGSPTGTISGGLLDPGGTPRNCDVAFSPFTRNSANSFDASTLSTSFSQVTFDFSANPYPILSGNFYDVNVQWNGCGGCDVNNYVTVEIAATAVATQNGIISANGKTLNDCANPVIGPGSDAHCPGTYDLLFNVFGAGPCAAGYSCSNSKIDASNKITLNANATFPGIMITNSPIDVSTSSAKELLFYETWHNSSVINANAWGWYLTTNKTLPTQIGYNPLNDPTVVFADLVYPAGGASNVKNYYEYQAKIGSQSQNSGGGLVSASGLPTNPYPNCPQTSTLYICNSGTAVYSSQFQGIASVLNFTGNGGNSGGTQSYSLFCVDSVPGAGSPTTNAYCSSSTQTPTLTPCTGTSQEICATPTFPFLNIQSGPYFLGFWSSSGQTGTVQFGTTNSGNSDARANSIWYWVPNPTTATPATIDTGGLFGPLIKAVLGIGIWIVTNVLSFLAFIASTVWPLFAGAWGFLANAVKTVLDAIGNFFGSGPLGTQLVSFFTSAGQFIVQYLSGVAAQIGNSLGFIVSAITQIIKFFNDAGGQIWSLLGDFLNVIGPVFQFFFNIYNVFTSMGLSSVQVMSLIMICWWIYGIFTALTQGSRVWWDHWVISTKNIVETIWNGMYWFIEFGIDWMLRLKGLVAGWL